MLQFGSNIAIFGVMLQLWIVLGNVQTPSSAAALGIPRLVFVALGCKRVLELEVKDDSGDDDDDVDEEKGAAELEE